MYTKLAVPEFKLDYTCTQNGGMIMGFSIIFQVWYSCMYYSVALFKLCFLFIFSF